MKKTLTSLIAVSAISLMTLNLSACMGNMGGNQAIGSVAGAAAGGMIGHQFGKGSGNTAMTILGTMFGGYMGSMFGQQMDQYNRQQVGHSLSNTPNYQRSQWTNPNTKAQYTMTPTSTYNANYQGQNTQCREYTLDGYIEGRPEQIKGKACRGADGAWHASN